MIQLLISLFVILIVVFSTTTNLVLAINTQNRTADEVLAFPGWNKPLPAKVFSGFVENGEGGYLHYLWEFPQDVDPATAPVTFWTNGGPGCSSLDFAFYEGGMFQMFLRNVTNPADAPNDAPFDLNPFAWNKRSHMIFLTHPAGVGPSFGENKDALNVNDQQDGKRNFVALSNLFKYKFSEYAKNDLWLAGESYGGIYVPMLTEQILDYLDAGNTEVFSGFKGILVGNGVTDDDWDDNFAFSTGLFMFGHGGITRNQFEGVVDVCQTTPYSDACQKKWDLLPSSLNVYGFAQWCYNPAKSQEEEQQRRLSGEEMRTIHYKNFQGKMSRRNRNRGALNNNKMQKTEAPQNLLEFSEANVKSSNDEFAAKYTPAEQQYMDENFGNFTPVFGTNYYDLDCTDEYWAEKYLSRNDVKMAMHLPLNFNFTICWDFPYTKTIHNVVPIYERLQKRKGATIIIYNGIQDLIVPYTGTFGWIEGHGWNQLTDYTPWEYTDKLRPEYGKQNGGWVMKVGSPNTYAVTVRNAGHMVPEDNPAAAFELFTRAISGNLWDLELLDSPKPFKSSFVDPSPQEMSITEKGKWIGVGFAICIGILVVVAVAIVLVNRAKSPRQRHAEAGVEHQPSSSTGYYNQAEA